MAGARPAQSHCYNSPMSNATDIEQAIERLPAAELAHLRRWFAEFDSKKWDEQFEHDAASGKLDALADEALTDLRDGKSTKL